MRYEKTLINITTQLCSSTTMYSLICLKASCLTLVINEMKCYLDGHYLLCLCSKDELKFISGYYDALNLQFLPYFYNVNLNHQVIEMPIYQEMRANYGYPDFHLFVYRDDNYSGILPIKENYYDMVRFEFLQAKNHIDEHDSDTMWSCRTRSNMISILRMAETAGMHGKAKKGMEIIEYICNNLDKDLTIASLCKEFATNRTTLTNIVKNITGLSPMNYIHQERLNQSRPDLLFTFVPINEIAAKYGFKDTNYYIRSFKKQFGTTPLKYRLEGREKRIRDEHIYHEIQKQSEINKLASNKN